MVDSCPHPGNFFSRRFHCRGNLSIKKYGIQVIASEYSGLKIIRALKVQFPPNVFDGTIGDMNG